MSVDIENPSYGPYCIPKDTPLDRQLQIPRAKVLRGFCKVQDYAGLCSMHAGLNNVNPGRKILVTGVQKCYITTYALPYIELRI